VTAWGQFYDMAALRSVCRAPLRQRVASSYASIATNHARIPQRQWRGYATTMEAQQKVRYEESVLGEYMLTERQVLSQDLEQADPTVYNIIEKVRELQ
jgi:glycine hydroxymethyltransferase